MLTLLDLSNNNPSPIVFGQIKQHGAYGLWHKVSEGNSYTDPDWKGRSAAARRAGLRVGGYHFARPPSFVLTAPASSDFWVSWTPGYRHFTEGCVLCNSSTAATLTIGASDCWFDAQYQ